MKTKSIRFASITFISLSVISILSVSMMAFINPQQVMDLVQVNLATTMHTAPSAACMVE